MSAGGGGAGGQIFSIGKSKAKLFDANSQVKITFKDVAGLEGAKEEVQEIVDFLKNPKKYHLLKPLYLEKRTIQSKLKKFQQ